MTMKKLTIALALLALAGCALPVTQVKTGAVRPTLKVLGAPPYSSLYVDGLLIGDATIYNGSQKQVFVEEGVHQVELKLDGRVLYTAKVFSSNGETSTVTYQAE
ncbi:putative uncharacterized protein [Janthinobacterium agaricidamnosum NBRC 102515 = DSM 9628]|uniref:PEGA domain-containing protein n=2 Tax=Janthinobacterium agaricidamnosum TaxID=55508 RepID=W0V0F9_9BURK|nr:putative uncharacterized protein [Janthinobacterium agaricidamnosum NBRC 102515 = DSM 9628]